MKQFSYTLLLIILPFVVIAQQKDSTHSSEKKCYVGIGLTNVNFHIYYKGQQTLWDRDIKSGYFAPIYLNFGYKLNERVSIQIGIANGKSKHHYMRPALEPSGEYVEYNMYSHTYAVAAPVTMRFIFLNTFKKHIPVYATASVMPAFGSTKGKITETRNDHTATTFSGRDSGINIFATAGFGMEYKIKSRFSGFAEILLFKSNLTAMDSKYFDWNGEHPKVYGLITSLGRGVNYYL